VKMNYHKGWKAYGNDEVLQLTRNDEGFMNVLVPFEGYVKIKFQYGSTLIDNLALGTTIAGIAMCLFLILGVFSRVQVAAKFFALRRKDKRT